MKRHARSAALGLLCLLAGGALLLTALPGGWAKARAGADRVESHVRNLIDPPVSPASLRARLVDDSNAVAFGAPQASDAENVVVFIDYNCGACRMLLRQLEIVSSRGRPLKVIVRHDPHDADSVDLAMAMLAARRQGKAERLHRLLMNADLRRRYGAGDLPALARLAGLDYERLQADRTGREVRAELAADRSLAWKLRVVGSPSMVVDDRLYRGWRTADAIEAIIDGEGDEEPTAAERATMRALLEAVTTKAPKPQADSCAASCEGGPLSPSR